MTWLCVLWGFLLYVFFFEMVCVLCNSGCPGTHSEGQRFTCFPSAGIKGMHHYAQLTESTILLESIKSKQRLIVWGL